MVSTSGATSQSPTTHQQATASTPTPPISKSGTWKSLGQAALDKMPSGIPLPTSLNLKDADTAKRIDDAAFIALIGFGTVYCLTNSFKLPVFIGAALYGAVRAKPEEVYQKPIDLIGTYLPLGKEKTGLLSLFINTDEKATPEQKLKTVSNLFLAALIANLFSPWLVQQASAIFFGYKAVEWVHGASQTKTEPAAAKPVVKEPAKDASLSDGSSSDGELVDHDK